MKDRVSPDEARKLVRECVCSDCWEPLVEHYDATTRTSEVSCGTKDCPQNGVVSKAYVERRKTESRAEAAEAKQVLRGAVAWIPKKSQEQLLAELGF